MLKTIVLILTENYKNILDESGELASFIREMKKHGAEVEVSGKSDIKLNPYSAQLSDCGCGTLFFSDDADILSKLQVQGYYTVAVYHEGVSGLLSGTQYALEGLSDTDWEYLYKVYQRFVGEPWSITETARCTIREICEADVDELYELYNSPNVTRYMEGLSSEKKQEAEYIKDYIENAYKYYGFGTWLIHRKEDGKLIGRAGFNYRPGYERAELGFIIGENFWRQGYAYEVCSHLMLLADRVYELEQVQALVKKENTASVGLLRKLGFSYMEEVELDGESYQRYLAKLAL